jgi:hypothetical protein
MNPKIHPNPSSDARVILKTFVDSDEPLTVNQIDNLGRKLPILQNIKVGRGQIEIPIQLFGKSGIHILEVLKGKQKETLRVVWV